MIISGFGNYGGTGIAIKMDTYTLLPMMNVYRYKLMENNEVSGQYGRNDRGGLDEYKSQHASKSITLDNNGFIYVNIGAPSNACQEKNREKGSPGMNPCPILDSAGGIWQFKTDKAKQHYSDGLRYATGIRNIVGLDWNNSANDLYAIQHGRDGPGQMFPDLYTKIERVELPAEEISEIKKDPTLDGHIAIMIPFKSKKVQGPEYGGDGKKTTGCEGVETPLYAFPAHWAPNALLFYTGTCSRKNTGMGLLLLFTVHGIEHL